ncbi:MAG: hypothetical protein CBARDMAM_0718 [uncultured Caballeronia sp.]|nr:MAG: hypothetical protein CBARDMAM_0718 [uncultured Caballeronia sp.]
MGHAIPRLEMDELREELVQYLGPRVKRLGSGIWASCSSVRAMPPTLFSPSCISPTR